MVANIHHPSFTSETDKPSEINPFGTTGGVKECYGKKRYGTDQTNSYTFLEPAKNYLLCGWIKSTEVSSNFDKFEFDVVDRRNDLWEVDENGEVL